MQNYTSPAQGHKELVNALHRELTKLRTLLALPGGIRVDALFPIPLRHSPSVQKKEKVVFMRPDEADYRAEAIDALTSMWLRPGQNPKETLRMPGACGLSHSAMEQVNVCNRLRMDMIELLSEVPSAADKTLLWRAHSNISSHQTLRMTPVLTDPLRLRFYWAIGDSISRYTVEELCGVWEKMLTELQGEVCSSDWCEPGTLNFRLALSIERLRMLDSNEWVAVRRILPPHVRARVQDGSIKPYLTASPVPFVYESSCLPPSVKSLTDYDPEAPVKPKKRSNRAKLMSEPYIEAMNVFRYRDQESSKGPIVREKTRNSRKRPN